MKYLQIEGFVPSICRRFSPFPAREQKDQAVVARGGKLAVPAMIAPDLARKLSDAGVDLGVMGIQWGRRPEVPPALLDHHPRPPSAALPARLRLRDDEHLGGTLLGPLGSAVPERLKLLHDIGLLDKLRPRVGRTEDAPEWGLPADLRGLESPP